MKAIVVVMEFHVRRHMLVPVAGLLLGCAGALAPFGVQSGEVFTRAIAQLAVAFALLTFAPSVMSRTARAGVPEFFFVHPVPWWAVWLGRLAAHVLLACALLAAVSLPFWWRHSVNVLSQFTSERPDRAFEMVFAFVSLVGVSAVAFAVFAARSTRATAICGASVAMGTWALVAAGGAFARGELPTAGPIKWVQLSTFGLPILLFTTVFLARGRGDGRRGAEAAALCAALGFLPSLAVAEWCSLAVRTASPAEFARVYAAVPVGHTRTVRVVGALADRHAAIGRLLVAGRAGATSLPARADVASGGTTLAWTDDRRGGSGLDLHVLDVAEAPGPEPEPALIKVPAAAPRSILVGVSPNGRRFAFVNDGGLAIFDRTAGQWSTDPHPFTFFPLVRFVDDHLVWALDRQGTVVRVRQFDVDAHSATVLLEATVPPGGVVVSPAARLLVVVRADAMADVFDAAGQRVAQFAASKPAIVVLADGRIVVADAPTRERVRVRVLSGGGQVRAFEVDAGAAALTAGTELAPGVVAIGVAGAAATLVVDVDEGALRHAVRGVVPFAAAETDEVSRLGGTQFGGAVRPGAVFVDGGRSQLVQIDPGSGEVTTLVAFDRPLQ